MIMKSNNIVKLSVIALLIFTASCEKYLDKTPESDLAMEDVFKDFEHAQGFVEQLYTYVVNYAAATKQDNANSFNIDESTVGNSTNQIDRNFDVGDLNAWQARGYFNKTSLNVDQVDTRRRFGIWNGWQAIRIANIAIANVEKMTGATQTEKDLILGQALFFRAYFHHEIMKFWGRIPYVDKVLTGNNDDFKMVRPATYLECALRADEDFAAAAELLPNNWDDLQNDPNATFLTFREETFGNNLLRINKAIIYSYKGRNLLYAASPLMQGTTNTYDYDEELCLQAAAEFAKVIKMDVDNVNNLGLATMANYQYVFYTTQTNRTKWPGTAANMGGGQGEFIFSSTAQATGLSTQLAQTFMPYHQNNIKSVPSHNFVHRVFGTANGLSCDEDPTHDFQHEFDNRDPRFYKWLIIDGDLVIQKTSANPLYRYARLYTGGTMRQVVNINHTGYHTKKWADITFNTTQKTGGAADALTNISCLWLSMRLTDVYLMYAEALAATSTYGVSGKPDYGYLSGMSALDVINIIRDRAGIPHVEVSYPGIEGQPEKFMDVLRRERSMELCFEGHRWMDLRRWVVAHLMENRVKSALDFERNNPASMGGRSTFTNINFNERWVLTRVCEYPKHYWLPFPTDQTTMYPGFEQNPGW
jgi:hypothetical protein